MSHPEPSSVAITGFGAVLPDAATPAAFWENVFKGHCSIRELPDDRWNRSLYLTSDPSAEDKTITAAAAFVDESIIAAEATSAGLTRPRHNRLHILAAAAADQAVRGMNLSDISPDRIAIYLGCMNVDEALAYERFLIDDGGDIEAHVRKTFPDETPAVVAAMNAHFARWKTDADTLRDNLFPTSVLALLRERLGAAGESMLIDAACASSLAAIDAGMRALQAGTADLVITGGIESNLAPYTFVLFSRLGVLARTRCLPLDANSDGMSQGEGAVIFVLEREEDARRRGREIHGLLAGCGASSDGATTSLFAPFAEGQLRAYEKAYRNLDRDEVVYVECHATGTRIGDETELRSLDRFFGRELPVGSVKSLVGHTKGAAGSVSLLKCLLSLKHRTIPPSPYFTEAMVSDEIRTRVNTAAIPIPEEKRAMFGVSSFGFGGINYHLVLREPERTARTVTARPMEKLEQVLLIGEHTRPTAGIRQAPALARFAIPPRNRPQIDEVQLAALLAVDELSRDLGIRIQRLDRSHITVISSGCLCLHAACVLAGRVNYFELEEALEGFPADVIATAVGHKVKHPPISGASGPGILNNVVAGRIANLFDLRGATFHVDADLGSRGAALTLARRIIARDGGMVILVSAEERYIPERARVERDAVTCTFLASPAYAFENNLPIAATIEEVVYAGV